AGHTVDYDGESAMAFRLDGQGNLEAFSGSACKSVRIDGREWVFADQPLQSVAWAPVAEKRRVEGGAIFEIMGSGQGALRVPAAGLPGSVEVVSTGRVPGSRGEVVPHRVENGCLVLEVGRNAPPRDSDRERQGTRRGGPGRGRFNFWH
ncbi:MAG: hypothetical protein M1457_09395, partial [bacterium]|nr:hypothetical protein [bacterium]